MGRYNLSPDAPYLVAEIRGSADFLAQVMGLRCVLQQGWKTVHDMPHALKARTLKLVCHAPEEEWDRIILDFSTEFQNFCENFCSEPRSDFRHSAEPVSHSFPESELRFRIEGSADIDADFPDESLLITPTVRVVRSRLVPDYIPPGASKGRGRRNSRIDILIESGWAFGTGSHPSTCCSIMAIEELCSRGLLHAGTRVLDMGTGTGILAICAALMGAGEVTAVDVDPEALCFARRNAGANGVENVVRVMSAEEWGQQAGSGHFDICLANLTLSVASNVMPSIAMSLHAGGILMLAGFKSGAAPTVHELLHRHGFEETGSLSRDGWCAVFAGFPLSHRSTV